LTWRNKPLLAKNLSNFIESTISWLRDKESKEDIEDELDELDELLARLEQAKEEINEIKRTHGC